jgi:hypothetical protein
MLGRGVRSKREVSKDDLDKFVQGKGFAFDGIRYTVHEPMAGGHWNKPVAAVEGEKFYLIEDA